VIYLVKERPLTMGTYCFRSSLIRLALRGPRRCCLLRKTVSLVPHKFPISLVSRQILYLPDSNHIVNIFLHPRRHCHGFGFSNQKHMVQTRASVRTLTMSSAGSIHYRKLLHPIFSVSSQKLFHDFSTRSRWHH